MSRVAFTDATIRALKAPSQGQVTYYDEGFPTFGCRVSQSGNRSFVVLHGPNRQRITIGRYPVVSLAQARKRAKEILAERTLGKHQLKTSKFADALDLFIESHCATNNKASTRAETERLLRKHFLPALRHFPLNEITAQQITARVDQLMPTPSEANHAFAAIHTFFRWAVRRRHIAHSPCEGMQLPSRPKSRDRVLADDELKAIWNAAHQHGYPFGVIVQLLILTGQRRTEIASLRWEYIDQDDSLVTLPQSVTKNGRRHTFPYGQLTAQLIETVPHLGDFLFPARGHSDRPFIGFSNAMAALRAKAGIDDWSLHDLRRTFATNLAAVGTPIQVTEKLLNHVSGSLGGVVGIYNRHSYFDEMRAAVQTWETRLWNLAQ